MEWLVLAIFGMSLVLILCFINQPLVELLDECASVAVDVVALVLPEPHLLALGTLPYNFSCTGGRCDSSW